MGKVLILQDIIYWRALIGLTQKQLENLSNRYKSYKAQKETFGNDPSSIFSILGISRDEIYCRTLKDNVSRNYFCGVCDNVGCQVKRDEVKSHSW